MTTYCTETILARRWSHVMESLEWLCAGYDACHTFFCKQWCREWECNGGRPRARYRWGSVAVRKQCSFFILLNSGKTFLSLWYCGSANKVLSEVLSHGASDLGVSDSVSDQFIDVDGESDSDIANLMQRITQWIIPWWIQSSRGNNKVTLLLFVRDGRSWPIFCAWFLFSAGDILPTPPLRYSIEIVKLQLKFTRLVG